MTTKQDERPDRTDRDKPKIEKETVKDLDPKAKGDDIKGGAGKRESEGYTC